MRLCVSKTNRPFVLQRDNDITVPFSTLRNASSSTRYTAWLWTKCDAIYSDVDCVITQKSN